MRRFTCASGKACGTPSRACPVCPRASRSWVRSSASSTATSELTPRAAAAASDGCSSGQRDRSTALLVSGVAAARQLMAQDEDLDLVGGVGADAHHHPTEQLRTGAPTGVYFKDPGHGANIW